MSINSCFEEENYANEELWSVVERVEALACKKRRVNPNCNFPRAEQSSYSLNMTAIVPRKEEVAIIPAGVIPRASGSEVMNHSGTRVRSVFHMGERNARSVLKECNYPKFEAYNEPGTSATDSFSRGDLCDARMTVCGRGDFIPKNNSDLSNAIQQFKNMQDAASNILEKSDYCTISGGKQYIKKSGWRKLAFFAGVSFEIREKHVRHNEAGMVEMAEFTVRASLRDGRFADAWGSCHCREKRFSKPNHDIPTTAETRAKSRACQDLLGIGE